MQYKITSPEKINVSIDLPASKSISNRILILNALSLSQAPIANLSDCEDTQVMIDAFNSNSNVFDVKGAGTAMRFLTAFLSGMEGEWILQGSKRMHERPIYPLVDALQALGADIEYIENKGYPPLKIRGKKLNGGEVFVSGSISSQFISALMMVAPGMKNGLTIHVQDKMISKPYVNITARMMGDYGVHVKWDESTIQIKPQEYKPIEYVVEPDWSAASYWYSMVALMPDSEVLLKGLSEDSYQGDANLVNLFKDLCVSTTFTKDGALVKNEKRHTKKFFHNFIQEPDLAQTFATTCCFLKVPFVFSGIQSLRIKETNRVEALKIELKKLGYILTDNSNEMLEWNGDLCFSEDNPAIDTYDDHRMAMSLVSASIPFKSILINDPMVVSKSYPGFWNDLERAGFVIETL